MESTAIPSTKALFTNDHLCLICNDIFVRPHDGATEFEEFKERSEADISSSIEAGCRLCTMLGEILKIHHLPPPHTTITITPRLVAHHEVTSYLLGGMTMGKYCRIVYRVEDEAKNKFLGKIDIALVPTDGKHHQNDLGH